MYIYIIPYRSQLRLHLGNDDAIFPSIHAIFQCGISERTGPNAFPGGPIGPLELTRLLGVVLQGETEHWSTGG